MAEIYDETDDQETEEALEPSPPCPLCGLRDAVPDDWKEAGITLKRHYTCSCGAKFGTGESVSSDEPIWVPAEMRDVLSDPKARNRLPRCRYFLRIDDLLVLVYDRRMGGRGYWEGLIQPVTRGTGRGREKVPLGPADDFGQDRSGSCFSFEQAIASPRLVQMRELNELRYREKQKVAHAIREREAREAAQGLALPPQ